MSQPPDWFNWQEFAAAHLIRGAQVAMDSLVEDATGMVKAGRVSYNAKGWDVIELIFANETSQRRSSWVVKDDRKSRSWKMWIVAALVAVTIDGRRRAYDIYIYSHQYLFEWWVLIPTPAPGLLLLMDKILQKLIWHCWQCFNHPNLWRLLCINWGNS